MCVCVCVLQLTLQLTVPTNRASKLISLASMPYISDTLIL